MVCVIVGEWEIATDLPKSIVESTLKIADSGTMAICLLMTVILKNGHCWDTDTSQECSHIVEWDNGEVVVTEME